SQYYWRLWQRLDSHLTRAPGLFLSAPRRYANVPQQIFKARVRPQPIQHRLDTQVDQKARALLAGFLKPPERLIHFAHAERDQREVIGGHVTLLRDLFEFLDDPLGGGAVAGEPVDVAEVGFEIRHVFGQRDGLFERVNRGVSRTLLAVAHAQKLPREGEIRVHLQHLQALLARLVEPAREVIRPAATERGEV